MQPGGSAVPQLPLCCGPVAELRLRCTAIGLYLLQQLLRHAGRRSLMRPTASGGRKWRSRAHAGRGHGQSNRNYSRIQKAPRRAGDTWARRAA